MRKYLNKGFSLAEAMVLLVVISIIMAVSAPLIAHKSNADQRRLVTPGPSADQVLTAQGGAQKFIIGSGNDSGNDEKLNVNGNAAISGDLKVGENFNILNGNNSATINIPSAFPQWGSISNNLSINTPYIASQNGYLYVENMSAGVMINGVAYSVGGAGAANVTVPMFIPIPAGISFSCNGSCKFIPVALSTNTIVSGSTTQLSANGGGYANLP